jgi:uncharacterized protein (TIGR04141 family)
MAEVRDASKQRDLDAALESLVAGGAHGEIVLGFPEVVSLDDIATIKYRDARSARSFTELSWHDFLSDAGGSVPFSALRRRHVRAFDATGEPLHAWSVYRCMYTEIEEIDALYVLNHGKWWRVDKEFVDTVNREVDAIDACTIRLLDYDHDDESAYIEAVLQDHGATSCKMHTRDINHGGGHGSIEFCDIFTTDRHLIHLKRYKGSVDMNHLFAQGTVAARLTRDDAEFRRKVNEKLDADRPTFGFADPAQRIHPDEWEVVFGIISQSKTKNSDLPMMCRVGLRNSKQLIEGMGFRISTVHIPSLNS